MRRVLPFGLALWASLAHAQPVTDPDAVPPLAQIRDEKQLAEALAAITRDPAIPVRDPKARTHAAALMAEGVRQLLAQSYEQALANFLEAYATFPSPKILLNIGSTLRDMGRLADAANTYQRYLADPATGSERVAEVKQLLADLDQQLTLLVIRVQPRGAEVSIDAGPFVAVGSTLATRVRPGLHTVRARKDGATAELTINGFEGETKDITLAVPDPASPVAAAPTKPSAGTPSPKPEPAEHVDGWLVTGRQYATADGSSHQRRVLAGHGGPEMSPIVPDYEVDDGVVVLRDERRITPGVVGLVRVDGKGRGLAGGLGIAVSPLDNVELELAALRAEDWGAYAGLRVRVLTGWLRPYVAGGVPLFFFTDDTTMDSAVAFGVRVAGGIELRVSRHVSVQGDLGVEHFFNVEDALVRGKRPEDTVFVPTLGVIGRL